ncbi:MAG TPA: glycosyltransferase, partial [Cyclobacteriaceae bacterium]|nr:glycosyltransferase [Cyclobacteriaceae bacterium]
MKIVFIGLTISSSWGNGHATTYRGLLKELGMMGHELYFLEHDKPWYSSNRDLGQPQGYKLEFYSSVQELRSKFETIVQTAHLVIVGSYVPQGVEVAEWVLETAGGVTAFYDIDTPVTLEKLDKGDEEYISKRLIPEFDLYLSFSGGEVLQLLEKKYRAKKAKALYCSVDPGIYYPMELEKEYSLGYLGTYSDDRQPTVQNFLMRPANLMRDEKFVVVGPGYPPDIQWPENVARIEHLPPDLHRNFYNRQKFTLNVTRQAMIKLGFSPSVRLFEAAACGVPIISDYWKGLTDLFEEGKEIFIARSMEDMVFILKNTSEEQRIKVGEAARKKIMNSHTASHRALELITYYQEV